MIFLVFQVEAKLAVRLQFGIAAWVEALESEGKQQDMDFSMDTDAPATATAHKPGGDPKFKV